ncbi:MAG: tRNA dihydrouridine synthase DusB [Oscillospiraceae bacterium]|nr:tRNA dihydrouridine synthase DusB [Oscillospiraceae bacterium]
MYLKKLMIGNVELENNIIIAPMAGITDKAFRMIIKEFNPGLVVTEMISAKGLYYDDEKTKGLFNLEDEKRPISVQIFGSEPESIRVAVEHLNSVADIIDINMGCPVPKIVKNGDGSKLLLNLSLAKEVIEAAVSVAKVPVSVKFRKGWDNSNVVACDLAKIAEKAGVKMLTIHGRTRSQFYSGNVDLDIIKQVKESVKIPVIGNGDIKTKEDALKMFEYTGVDGIMIGRASLGNPWIISDIINYLQDQGNYVSREISKEEKVSMIMKHLDLMIKYKGENRAVKEIRKHICYYVKNMDNSARIREKINMANSKMELVKILSQ